jgi:hypothetical protein
MVCSNFRQFLSRKIAVYGCQHIMEFFCIEEHKNCICLHHTIIYSSFLAQCRITLVNNTDAYYHTKIHISCWQVDRTSFEGVIHWSLWKKTEVEFLHETPRLHFISVGVLLFLFDMYIVFISCFCIKNDH